MTLYRDEIVKAATHGTITGIISFAIFLGGIWLQRVAPQSEFGGMLLAVAFAVPSVFYILQSAEVKRLNRRQDWTINALQVGFQRIQTTVNEFQTHGVDAPGVEITAKKWPWGEHHTEMLGNLEAAANKFWTLYDKGDPSTAPLNEMVADWLQTERGVSKDKARAIASILRADGLPTGPRK